MAACLALGRFILLCHPLVVAGIAAASTQPGKACAPQGLVLDCSPLQWAAMSRFPDAPTTLQSMPAGALPVWLALDEISDPVRRRVWLSLIQKP